MGRTDPRKAAGLGLDQGREAHRGRVAVTGSVDLFGVVTGLHGRWAGLTPAKH